MAENLKTVILKCTDNKPLLGQDVDLDFALAVVGRSMVTYGVYANCTRSSANLKDIATLEHCFCVTITDPKHRTCHVIAYEEWFYKIISNDDPNKFELGILESKDGKIDCFVIFDK